MLSPSSGGPKPKSKVWAGPRSLWRPQALLAASSRPLAHSPLCLCLLVSSRTPAVGMIPTLSQDGLILRSSALITTAETLFPRSHFPGPGWGHGRLFWGPPFNHRSDSGKPLGLPLASISSSISGLRGLALSVLGSLTFPARLVWWLVAYTSSTWRPPPAFGQILEPSVSPCARPKRGTVQLTKGTGRVQHVTELMETEDLIPLLL